MMPRQRRMQKPRRQRNKRMKKLALMILMAVLYRAQSQVVYSERFNGSTLTSYTASNGAGSYTSMPASFYNINDGRYNNVGTSLNPNTPFNNSALKTAGW